MTEHQREALMKLCLSVGFFTIGAGVIYVLSQLLRSALEALFPRIDPIHFKPSSIACVLVMLILGVFALWQAFNGE